MIKKIKVDGFRSLSGFEIEIRKGLNILVGPNGAGKTNIILFFEFLSALFVNRIAEAVNKCGGAGAVFRRSDASHTRHTIRVLIDGETKQTPYGSKEKHIAYQYNFQLTFSDTDDIVYFSEQELRFSSSAEKQKKHDDWDLIVKSKPEADGEYKYDLSIEKLDFRKNRFESFHHGPEPKSRAAKIATLESFFKRAIVDPEQPISVGLQRYFPEFRAIHNDFVGGHSLNVIPSVAKQQEDSATPPGVRRDGSGLAATLYALQKQELAVGARNRGVGTNPLRHFNGLRMRTDFQYYRNAYSSIQNYIKLVNSEVDSFEVKKDHEDNSLRIVFRLVGEDDLLTLPFSFMSDGTVKWTALVTAIFTNRNMFAIEEPENFIHPLMQQEILKLMREATRRGGENYFILLTTHSETLLNAAAPEEVIVVRMEKGKTIARRPRQVDLIREEINKTGFGLGYMYLSGILNDA